MKPSAHTLNALLPQTQCRECGFSGCLPYAEAMAAGEAAVNLCAPGGVRVMRDLAQTLGVPEQAPAKIQPAALAWIDEDVCIGCTACIRACPVDAIMGAAKLMHTVLTDECTGCGLCVAPCPVDCIHMLPVADDSLPRAHLFDDFAEPPRFQAASDSASDNGKRFQAAAHAYGRYQAQQRRKEQEAAERERRQAERRAAIAEKRQAETAAAAPAAGSPAATAAAFNPAALIARAMARAQAQQGSGAAPANRDRFRESQLEEDRRRAAQRRAMRDLQYGSDEQKAAAREWLRQNKQQQNAAE